MPMPTPCRMTPPTSTTSSENHNFVCKYHGLFHHQAPSTILFWSIHWQDCSRYISSWVSQALRGCPSTIWLLVYRAKSEVVWSSCISWTIDCTCQAPPKDYVRRIFVFRETCTVGLLDGKAYYLFTIDHYFIIICYTLSNLLPVYIAYCPPFRGWIAFFQTLLLVLPFCFNVSVHSVASNVHAQNSVWPRQCSTVSQSDSLRMGDEA
jgi:hypothetical protein